MFILNSQEYLLRNQSWYMQRSAWKMAHWWATDHSRGQHKWMMDFHAVHKNVVNKGSHIPQRTVDTGVLLDNSGKHSRPGHTPTMCPGPHCYGDDTELWTEWALRFSTGTHEDTQRTVFPSYWNNLKTAPAPHKAEEEKSHKELDHGIMSSEKFPSTWHSVDGPRWRKLWKAGMFERVCVTIHLRGSNLKMWEKMS